MNTLADFIMAAVAPYIPPQLISPQVLADIQPIAALLPGAVSDFFGFECILGRDRPSADFLVCSRVRRDGREVLAGRKPGSDLQQFLLDHPIWRRIRNFAEEWIRPERPLYRGVHNLWMEFDLDRVTWPIPSPNIFIGSDHLRSASGCQWLTHMALPLLLGDEMHESHRAAVAQCIDRLPAAASVFQVGIMLARESRNCRLCVRGMSPGELVEYLPRVDWNGSPDDLSNLLAAYMVGVQRLDLDIDVADRVLPRIGLELYPSSPHPQWPALLSSLVSAGLCTEPKAAAICRWPGLAYEGLSADPWPNDLLAVHDAKGNHLHSVFDRAIHHVKLTHQPGAPLQAKVYLAVHHRFLTLEQLESRFPSIASSSCPPQFRMTATAARGRIDPM